MRIVESLAFGDRRAKHKIAVITLHGQIQFSDEERKNTVMAVERQIERAKADSKVVAAVLEISSPGGGVVASDCIYSACLGLADDTPLIAYIRDIGASGGYYAACAAHAIVSHKYAVVGSIGVILQLANFEGLLQKLGIRAVTFAEGRFKDMGSPFRDMSAEETAMFNGEISQLYDRFVFLVKRRRGDRISRYSSDEVFTSRVFSGERAAATGLVDKTGYLQDASHLAQALAETKFGTHFRSVKTVRYSIKHRSPLIGRLMGSSSVSRLENLLGDMAQALEPGYYYLWKP